MPHEAVSTLRTDAVDAIYFRVAGPDNQFVARDKDLLAVLRGTTNPSFDSAIYHDQPVRLVSYRSPSSVGAVTTVVAETLNKRRGVRSRLWLTALGTDVLELDEILCAGWFGVSRK